MAEEKRTIKIKNHRQNVKRPASNVDDHKSKRQRVNPDNDVPIENRENMVASVEKAFELNPSEQQRIPLFGFQPGNLDQFGPIDLDAQYQHVTADSNQPSKTTIAPNQSLRASDAESAVPSSGELSYKANVHVWDTSFLAVEPGHVSLTLKKIWSDKNKSLHFGFWPERELTPYDALSNFNAKVKKSLDEEINYSPDQPAWKPNKQYEISINKEQYKDMKKEINEYSQKIDSGQIRYTWCVPFKNTIGFIYGSPPNQRLENCSTSTTQILNKGKIPIQMGYVPWGITPSEVGYQLEKLITGKVIKGKVIPVDDKKARQEDVSTQQPKHQRVNSDTNLFNQPSQSASQQTITGTIADTMEEVSSSVKKTRDIKTRLTSSKNEDEDEQVARNERGW